MSAPAISIAGRAIGADHPPYVIAELSGNHNGSLERALTLLRACAEAGADAVKLQTYTADTMTIDFDGPGFVQEGGLWDGRTLYDLYEEAHTPWAWHATLFNEAKRLGVALFSSPFDPTAVEFLEQLDAPAYKIASFEVLDLPLIRCCAATGKPMIISTGMASPEEIQEALDAARAAGCEQIILLHCVSAYPAPPESMHLTTIPDLAARYETVVGLSDHTLGNAAAVASVALGARVIEKHVCLSRAEGGVDSAFSLEPEELRQLVSDARTAHAALGTPQRGTKSAEKGNLAYRRSLYVVADVAAGEPLTPQNIRAIRPGYGLPPKHLDTALGKLAKRDLKRGEPLALEMFAE
ncbi:pseudaminic acid synthase [Magnetofaba australis]|uniref:Putative neuB protein n=1 Tax=Magnetofaba australis IT-1 TaxID=1434232 RepID=A0A1Y2K5L8_9PROT|nr:pseudaminic acid synthase [Magnetofaba australis]OSM02295.1 putative neuB protein [Magnetofaba australis IT-1]